MLLLIIVITRTIIVITRIIIVVTRLIRIIARFPIISIVGTTEGY